MTRTGQDSADGATARWYAFYTRARHEKKVEERFRRQGLEAFLPLVPREREWHDRTATVEWPMFPSYVFGRMNRTKLHRASGTPGVVTYVSFNGSPSPLPDAEIESVRRLAAGLQESDVGAESAPLPEKGMRVRVTNGPLEGVVGRVSEHRGGDRVLVVGVEAIRQGLKVEVDPQHLETVNTSDTG